MPDGDACVSQPGAVGGEDEPAVYVPAQVMDRAIFGDSASSGQWRTTSRLVCSAGKQSPVATVNEERASG